MPTTAYFAFSAANRAEVREHLERERNAPEDTHEHAADAADAPGQAPGQGPKRAGVSVADVAKELGRRWRLLTDEERQGWKEAAAKEGGGADGGGGLKRPRSAAGDGGAKAPAGLPVARLKKMLMRDADFKRVAKDALGAFSQATESFIVYLSTLVYRQTKGSKRKTMKLDDLATCVRRHQNLSFLREHLPAIEEAVASAAVVTASAAQNEERARKAAEARLARKEREGAAPPPAKIARKQPVETRTRTITSFFGAKPTDGPDKPGAGGAGRGPAEAADGGGEDGAAEDDVVVGAGEDGAEDDVDDDEAEVDVDEDDDEADILVDDEHDMDQQEEDEEEEDVNDDAVNEPDEME